jgi:uncharacterized protein YlbG (UPF0298 family)
VFFEKGMSLDLAFAKYLVTDAKIPLSQHFAKEYNDFNRYSLKGLNVDLLTIVLSLTQTSQTFEIARVCKKWNNIFKTSRLFWVVRIKRFWQSELDKFERLYSNNENLQKDVKEISDMIDKLIKNVHLCFLRKQSIDFDECMHYLFTKNASRYITFYNPDKKCVTTLTIWGRSFSVALQVFKIENQIRFFECFRGSIETRGLSCNHIVDPLSPLKFYRYRVTETQHVWEEKKCYSFPRKCFVVFKYVKHSFNDLLLIFIN